MVLGNGVFFFSFRTVSRKERVARARVPVFSFGSSPSSAGRLRLALESKPLNTTALVSSSLFSLSLSLSLLKPVCRFYFEYFE